MINPLFEKQILAQLNKLSNEQQQQVLDFAQFLAMKNPVGVPGKDLLQFAGVISDQDAKVMLEAAEENWGQADLKAWTE
ncbi:hypothetical protein [Iningainema tapete]|uniref:DUF2281 domain-containing protein n=1 Tax=Iningainema tapete BLCC-T55 TaxID=2748662 RepID=A0A8J6XE56_9CYAN|nr:hypothetical protein [Iningainema tapete]MBD2773784.1 hypothetical protein [Iningainema tapete BLCC-T55]